MNGNGGDKWSGEGDDRREAILRAACAAFFRHGFHEATVEEIAREAGVGKGTVYFYFPAKEALLEEAVRSGFQAYVRALREAASGPGTVRERLTRMVEAGLTLAFSFAPAGLLLRELPPIGGEVLRELARGRKEVLDLFASLIREGIATGELGRVPPDTVALVLSGALRSLFLERILSGASPPPAEAARELVELLFQGLGRGSRKSKIRGQGPKIEKKRRL